MVGSAKKSRLFRRRMLQLDPISIELSVLALKKSEGNRKRMQQAHGKDRKIVPPKVNKDKKYA